MYYLIPTNEKFTRCSCGQIHYWEYGESEHECECGRVYRKSWRNVTISMTDEHAHGESETDRLEDEWHARQPGMTQAEIDEAFREDESGQQQPQTICISA